MQSNWLWYVLYPTKTPKLTASKQQFEELIHHEDAYPLNAQRNIIFMVLENVFKDAFEQNTVQDGALKRRYTLQGRNE
ncbi:Uncharacterised protein [Providencia stuartii]|nr:Uncharacterised protein [Providencia stuartii]